MLQIPDKFNVEKRIPPSYSIVGTLFIFNRQSSDASTAVTAITVIRGALTTRSGMVQYTCSGLTGSAGQYCYTYSDADACIEISAEL